MSINSKTIYDDIFKAKSLDLLELIAQGQSKFVHNR